MIFELQVLLDLFELWCVQYVYVTWKHSCGFCGYTYWTISFLMWTIFKVFIEFVTILFLFYISIFWTQGDACGILAPLSGIKFTPPCNGKWSFNHWATGEAPQQFCMSDLCHRLVFQCQCKLNSKVRGRSCHLVLLLLSCYLK